MDKDLLHNLLREKRKAMNGYHVSPWKNTLSDRLTGRASFPPIESDGIWAWGYWVRAGMEDAVL
jgi:hypothetical protein